MNELKERSPERIAGGDDGVEGAEEHRAGSAADGSAPEARNGHDAEPSAETAIVSPPPPTHSPAATVVTDRFAALDDTILITPRRRPWRLLVFGLLALAVVALALYFLFFQPSPPPLTAVVRRGSIISTVETTGKLEAAQSANIAFRTSGRVVKIIAKEGDQVKVGDVLAELDTASLKRNLDQANVQLQIAQLRVAQAKQGPSKSDLAAAQARLQQAKSNRDQVSISAKNATAQARIAVDQANNNLKNAQAALDKINRDNGNKKYSDLTADEKALLDKATRDMQDAQGKVSQAQLAYDTARQTESDQIQNADAQVTQAQAALDGLNAGPSESDLAILDQQVKLAQIGVDNAASQLSDAQLIAPVDGTVLSINLDVGELVGAQQPVATIANVNTLQIKGDIDEIDVGRVSPGQAVTVTLDAYPGVKMPGKIEALAPGATLKQGSTVYQATISFTPPPGVYPREGMAANVDITAERKDNVLILPNRAFQTVGTHQFVTVQDARGTTTNVQVETGLSNTTDTEVISGVHEGQVVIIK